MKVKLIFGSIIISALCFVWVFYDQSELDQQPEVLVSKIHSDLLNEDLFIKKISWGLTYDHNVFLLTCSPDKSVEPDSTSEYIFLSSELFYKVSNDSLYIFTSLKAKTPLIFNSKFKVVQQELENVEIMKLREDKNYKKEGLEMIY